MILVANWKMNLGVGESEKLARDVVRGLKSSRARNSEILHSVQDDRKRAVILCPSFPALDRVARVLRSTNVALGAQDAFWQSSGAFTGEVSARELKELGCKFVIIGHSERRALGETDNIVNKKLHAALAAGLTPILCVGEPLSVRRTGRQVSYVQKQLKAALKGLRRPRLMVAYEPIWAISTSKSATESPAAAEAMARIIHAVIPGTAVIYGGSVNPANAAAFLKTPGIQGALVGGASLNIKKFLAIVRA